MKKNVILCFFFITTVSFAQWNQTLNGTSVWSLAKDINGNIYAGSLTSTSALYKTTNIGLNWISLTGGNGQTIFGIAVDSMNNIFAANFSNGLLRSTNAGMNFTTMPISNFGNSNLNTVACGRNNYVYAGTNGAGLFRSTDGGSTFSPTNLTTAQIITIVPDRFNSSIIYAGATSTTPGTNGFYRSTDYGATFSPNYNSGINVYGIVQPGFNMLVTVSTSSGGPVHRSTNGGLNWVVAATGYVCRGAVMLDERIFVSGNSGVHYSTNNGTSFVNAGLTISTTPITSHLNRVYTGASGSTNGGVWVYTDPLGITNLNETATEFMLSQNYPNPFNPATKIKFVIPSGNRSVRSVLKIFDALGREIETLADQQLNPGTYEVNWDASNYPSGVYIYKFISGDFTDAKKMILLK